MENLNETENNGLIVSDFGEMQNQTNTKRKIYTTIEDTKVIFNLENSCDYKINDCKGEKIRVTDVLVKINEKPMKEPIIDEETGEVIKDKEVSMVTILLDDNKKSYVTGSKIFTMQMINYFRMFGLETIKEGLEIAIIEKSVKNSPNKALGFELV